MMLAAQNVPEVMQHCATHGLFSIECCFYAWLFSFYIHFPMNLLHIKLYFQHNSGPMLIFCKNTATASLKSCVGKVTVTFGPLKSEIFRNLLCLYVRFVRQKDGNLQTKLQLTKGILTGYGLAYHSDTDRTPDKWFNQMDYTQNEATINFKMCHGILMTRFFFFLLNTDMGKGRCTSIANAMAGIL